MQARDKIKGRFRKFNQCENGFEEERIKSEGRGLWWSRCPRVEVCTRLVSVDLQRKRTDTSTAMMEGSIRFDNGLDMEGLL